MASRKRKNKLPRNKSWKEVDVKELADMLANRTGLDKGEIRQVLQELEDTSVYVGSGERCKGRKRR